MLDTEDGFDGGATIRFQTVRTTVLVVHTTIPLEPESREEAINLVADLVEYSRTEDGTVRYRAMEDVTETSVLRFFEQYEDTAAAEAHTRSDQYRQFVTSLPDLVDGNIETVQFETDDVECVEFSATEAVAALD